MFGLGAFLGGFSGRWFAEVQRARYDRKRIWQKRKDYRSDENERD